LKLDFVASVEGLVIVVLPYFITLVLLRLSLKALAEETGVKTWWHF